MGKRGSGGEFSCYNRSKEAQRDEGAASTREGAMNGEDENKMGSENVGEQPKKSETEQDEQEKKKDSDTYMAEGMAIGMALGAALGVAFNNVAIGISLGMLGGIALGTSKKKK